MRTRCWLALGSLALSLGCSGVGRSPDEPLDDAIGDEPEAREPEAPAPPPGPLLPLAVGDTWTYALSQRTGAGARIFGFATVKPSTADTATWTLTIDSVDPDGRFHAKLLRAPVEGLPSTTEMTLTERDGVVWMDAGNGERPAIEAVIPPGAVSSERVRCIAHVLGGVVGSCPPVVGGPLGVAPGLEHGVVGADLREGAEAGQFLVGILTVGIFIPGNRKRVETAHRVGFVPGEEHAADFAPGKDPLVAAVDLGTDEPGPLLEAIAEHGAAPESVAAAIATLDPGRVIPVTAGILDAVAPADRYPVVRTALQRTDDPLRTFAHLRRHLDTQIPEAQATALLAGFETEADRSNAAALIEGGGELFTVLLAETAGPFDSDVTEVLDRELDAHPVTGEELIRIMGLFTFDEGKRDAAEKLLGRIPQNQHPELIRRILQALVFDDARLQVLTAHAEVLKPLPIERREELVDTISFQQAEARAILGLDPM